MVLIDLLKMNADLPFGDFKLLVFYKRIDDNQFYNNHSLYMGSNIRPISISVEKSYLAFTTEEEDEDDESSGVSG